LLLFLFLAMAFAEPAALSTALQQGLMALRDGKLVDARTSFEAVVQQDPKNAFAWVSLAETCRRIGDNTAAYNAAQKAEQFGGNIPPVDHALASFYSQEGQLAHAAALEEKYAASPKVDPQAALRAAELYQRAGDRTNAERVLKAAWQRRINDPLVAFGYAQVLLQKLDFAGAENAVSAASKANPNDPQLILVAGVAHYGERRFTDAIDNFLKVIAIDPSIPQPYEFIGKMMEQAGPRLPAIVEAFEIHAKNMPNDAMAYLVLAKAKLAVNSKDPAVETLLRRSAGLDPNQWESHYQLGVLLESKHDFEGAAKELKRSIAVDPQQPMPHYHLARVYDRLGDGEQAAAERKLHEQLSNVSK
jgi:tetratricopeptide (TPR) repeat protein